MPTTDGPARSQAKPATARGQALRLFGLMRPYVGFVLLAALLSASYSGGRYLRAWLAKPLLDEILVPHGASAGATSSTGSWLGLGPFAKGASRESETADAALDRARSERLIARAKELGAVIAALIVAMPVLFFAQELTVSVALGRVLVDMKRAIANKLLVLPLRFHQGRRRGDVLSRAVEDAAAAHGALDLAFGDFIEALLSVLVGACFLLAISWPLALGGALVAPILVAAISTFTRRIRRTARRRQEKLADVNQRLLEILEGIKVIRAFRAEEVEREAFRRETETLFRRSLRVAINRIGARSLVEFLNFTAAALVMGVGLAVLLGGRLALSSGDLAAFAAVLFTLYAPTRTLARGWVRFLDALPAAERYFEVLDSEEVPADPPGAMQISRSFRELRFVEVGFDYGREPVLDGISLAIRAGEVVALVGRTGAGKTTLADLVLRLHDPDRGHIEVDGVDLRRIARAPWLDQLAVVGQEPFLFDGSIRSNIAYGRPGASDPEIEAAARAAYVDEFADKLPQGLDTQVGAMGSQLSGGQRQRVTIARALLRDPALLILDEATSALDAKSEAAVQRAIDALLGRGRAVLVIAHRLASVRRADRIAVIEHGRITQLGRHEALIAQPGLYRELHQIQAPPGTGVA
jgi:ABC-type multidrug transport system fused ATPase/permease subunit